jgi:hypothetical protein
MTPNCERSQPMVHENEATCHLTFMRAHACAYSDLHAPLMMDGSMLPRSILLRTHTQTHTHAGIELSAFVVFHPCSSIHTHACTHAHTLATNVTSNLFTHAHTRAHTLMHHQYLHARAGCELHCLSSTIVHYQ